MKRILVSVFTVVVLLTMALTMSGCGNKVVLNVFNWGEYMDKSYWTSLRSKRDYHQLQDL